jgi:hypothetical protein
MDRKANPLVEQQRGLVSDTATAVAQGFGAGAGGVAAHKVIATVSGRLNPPKPGRPKN